MSGHEGERQATGAIASHLAPCCETWLAEQLLVEMRRGRESRIGAGARRSDALAPIERWPNGLPARTRRRV